MGLLLKIILFGSHARGGWVDNPARGYHSDYDLLIVVDHEDLTDVAEFWDKTETEVFDQMSAAGTRTESLSSNVARISSEPSACPMRCASTSIALFTVSRSRLDIGT